MAKNSSLQVFSSTCTPNDVTEEYIPFSPRPSQMPSPTQRFDTVEHPPRDSKLHSSISFVALREYEDFLLVLRPPGIVIMVPDET